MKLLKAVIPLVILALGLTLTTKTSFGKPEFEIPGVFPGTVIIIFNLEYISVIPARDRPARRIVHVP